MRGHTPHGVVGLPSRFWRMSVVVSIGEIVQEALYQGCLTVDAENQLRRLLAHCRPEDVLLFARLQAEIMEGRVRQEARERYHRQLEAVTA